MGELTMHHGGALLGTLAAGAQLPRGCFHSFCTSDALQNLTSEGRLVGRQVLE